MKNFLELEKHAMLNGLLLKNQNYDFEVIQKAIEKTRKNIEDIEHGMLVDFVKYGNNKLNTNIMRLDMPEVMTCHADCHGCYAKKQLYKNVKIYRLSNLFLIWHAIYNHDFRIKFLNNFEKLLKIHYTKHGKLACMRFHASGDIFNIEYFTLIKDVIKLNKKVKFYTYTKNMHAFLEYQNEKSMGNLKNLNIVNSFIKNHVNYFDFNNKNFNYNDFFNIILYCKEKNKKVFLCDYALKNLARKKIKKLIKDYKLQNTLYLKLNCHCGSTCMACMSNKYDFVIFCKH